MVQNFYIVSLSVADSPEIEAFLRATETLNPHQFPAWGEFQSVTSGECLRLGVRDESKQLVAYAQIFVRRWPLGLTWLHVARGPVVNEELRIKNEELQVVQEIIFSEIKKLGVQKKAVFVRFDFPESFNPSLIPKTYTLYPSHATNFPDTTLILDLTKTEEELLAEMKPKGRYNIRVAEKHGVTVREMTSASAAKTFFALLEKTTARDGFSAHPASYYASFLEVLGGSGNASCFLAEQNGVPVAASLVTFFGNVATYYYGASDHAYRNLMAPYLVQWTAIQSAKKRGAQVYDFLGIAPEDSLNHHLTGVTDFKRKFGGTIVRYPASAELVLCSGIYRLITILKHIKHKVSANF